MTMANRSDRVQVATAEDYDSDQSERPVLGFFRRSFLATSVAVKHSNPVLAADGHYADSDTSDSNDSTKADDGIASEDDEDDADYPNQTPWRRRSTLQQAPRRRRSTLQREASKGSLMIVSNESGTKSPNGYSSPTLPPMGWFERNRSGEITELSSRPQSPDEGFRSGVYRIQDYDGPYQAFPDWESTRSRNVQPPNGSQPQIQQVKHSTSSRAVPLRQTSDPTSLAPRESIREGNKNQLWEEEKKTIEAVFANWSGRGVHVDFQSNEDVPLVQGRFLGHGSMGSVFETVIHGHAFAWKKRFCRRKIGDVERKEIEILKKVSHHHIIKLAGSYTHGQFLGLLLHPVAICDLATLFEDIEAVTNIAGWNHMQTERLQALCLQQPALSTENPDRGKLDGEGTLKILEKLGHIVQSRMGCLISAVEYLHNQRIRHKDLKPSNILLSADNMWLTDFGTATDFSNQTISTTDNCERGTPKYFAPEMASFEKCGRSADIFSLACVLLEMHVLRKEGGLANLRDLRPKHGKSYHENLDNIRQWLSIHPEQLDLFRDHIVEMVWCEREIKGLILRMMDRDPMNRPTIRRVREIFALIDRPQSAEGYPGNTPIFGECCRNILISRTDHEQQIEDARAEATQKVKAEMQSIIDQLTEERDHLRTRTVELEGRVDQQLQSLNAWVQRDAFRLQEEEQVNLPNDDPNEETRAFRDSLVEKLQHTETDEKSKRVIIHRRRVSSGSPVQTWTQLAGHANPRSELERPALAQEFRNLSASESPQAHKTLPHGGPTYPRQHDGVDNEHQIRKQTSRRGTPQRHGKYHTLTTYDPM